MLKVRLISSIIGLPLIFAILFYKGSLLYIFALLLSLVGLYEYFKAMQVKKIEPIKWYGYSMTLIYYSIILKDSNGSLSIGIITLSLIALISVEIFYQKHNIVEIAISIFGFLYISVLFSCLVQIGSHKYGNILIWLPFITAWVSDTSAYFVGVNFGKRKLCPHISPKKTIEGSIGGVVGSMAFTTLFGYIINSQGYTISIIHFIIIGVICGVVSQIGDLSASYIKRFAGIKDFGTIIPGHGGILDRFDSVLFTAPAIFYYFLFIVP